MANKEQMQTFSVEKYGKELEDLNDYELAQAILKMEGRDTTNTERIMRTITNTK